MTVKNRCVVGAVGYFILVGQLLCAQKTHSEVSLVPPTGLNLIGHERAQKEQQSLKKIENIVSRVVARKKLSGNRNKLTRRKNATNSTQLFQRAEQNITPYFNKILKETYLVPELSQKKISLHLKKTDIKKALALISKMGKISCIVDANIQGNIRDLKLENISIGAAIQLLLESNSPRLALVRHHDVWRVVTIPVAQELLQDQIIALEEQGYLHDNMTFFHAKWDESLKRRVEHLWLGIVGKKASSEGAYITFDDASKKVFFRAKRKHADDFIRCLGEIDQPIAQIKIDARVVVASKDFDENFGLQWSGVYNRRASASVKHFDFIGLGPITSGDPASPDYSASHDLVSNLIGWTLNFLPTGMVTKTGMSIPIVFGTKDLSTKRLNLLLNMAETRNEIKTILKPSLLVNSEECAEILVGEQLPQETRVDETIEGKLTNVTTTQYKDVGMKIRVKPMASPDKKSVFLDIYVENSSVVKQELAGSQTVNNGGLFTYTIETSRSKNRVLLKSGQTTLMSGLIVKTEERMKTGIPYLQDIPILGWLFKGSRKHLVDRQILIFISPTIA
jgi:type IV pilus assembly protein PilQ